MSINGAATLCINPLLWTRSCQDGLLLVDKPRSRSLRRPWGLGARFWTLPSNLFFEDLRMNARARTEALIGTGNLPTRVRALDALEVIDIIESPVTPYTGKKSKSAKPKGKNAP